MGADEPVLDTSAVAQSLSELTAGWTPAVGIDPTVLTAARSALAGSLLAGRAGEELRATPTVTRAAVPAPELAAELLQIAQQATSATATGMLAVVRSPLSASPTNPGGAPAWTLGAQVLDRLGPFQDATGALHWIDLLPITTSTQIAFDSAATPFAVLPVRHDPLPLELPPSPDPITDLELGAGSVWFQARLLGAAFPAGAFTGFEISGGMLRSTDPLTISDGVYVAPAGATLTLDVTPAPSTSAPSGASVGPDAVAATVTPPADVQIVFTQASATLEAFGPASASAYGTTVALQWTGQPPALDAEESQVLIPCTASLTTFDFASVASHVFVPAQSAALTAAGWALPLAANAISTLPEIAGPGACELHLGAGAELRTELNQRVSVAEWVLEIGSQTLLVIATSAGPETSTALTLWPEAPPSTRRAAIEVETRSGSRLAFIATPSSEGLLAAGGLVAHLDRPLNVSGGRIPYTSRAAIATVLHTQSSTIFAAVAAKPVNDAETLSLALENALLGVIAPDLLIAVGPLSGHRFSAAFVTLGFELVWLLPTLPDPYATSFDATAVREKRPGVASVLTGVRWDGSDAPTMSCALLADAAAQAAPTLTLARTAAAADSTPPPADTAAPAPEEVAAAEVRVPTIPQVTTLALLDLSTKVDLFGVALAPALAEVALRTDPRSFAEAIAEPPAPAAPAFALDGMSLAFNGALVATFALPQVSWEPVESTETPDVVGPIFAPDTDGFPLVLSAPDSQQLVPFAPAPVLANNIDNVRFGTPFAAVFSLPFGLNALIVEAADARFSANGGTFKSQAPEFQLTASEQLRGAVSLTLEPVPDAAGGVDAMFGGETTVFGSYGETILGSSVRSIFDGDFGASGLTAGVPLLRVDFSGYGASIFSDWLDSSQADSTGIIKVQFQTTRGRAIYEVIQAKSLIHPYAIRVVRTITMERQNAGWIKRTDSGWVAGSPGQFQFPGSAYDGKFNPGPFAGAFNVRNIRERGPQVQAGSPPFTYQQVLFDADLGVNPSLEIRAGGFEARVKDVTDPPPLVSSKNIVGYVQITDGDPPAPAGLAALMHEYGPFRPAVSFTAEAGRFGAGSGTVLRCSAFEVAVVTTGVSAADPSFGVALYGAPQIPRGGGWSMAVRHYTNQSPVALANDFPVPLVQSNAATDLWQIADIADLLSLQKPVNYYSLMHATGTNKVLFEAPQIPVSAAGSSGSGVPGLQFPKLPSPLPTGIANPGTPNLGDLASILNATGLFPDLSSALSILDGELPQIQTIPEGFKYTKTHTFGSAGDLETTTLIDIDVIKLDLVYGLRKDPHAHPPGSPTAAQLVYTVDSSQSPSWSLSIGPLSFEVTIPLFGSSPILAITGGFYGDENTKPGLTNLNVVYGDALSIVTNIMQDIQALASFLPGGVGADLDVAVSDGQVTVSDTFSIADLPLGFGDLTNVSLDLGLDVTISPLSVNFLIGLGSQDNPVDWIMTPLAGTGMVNLGVQDSSPALIIQGGIGLGIAIDLGIASGSASITISVELDINGSTLTLILTLTGQASVDVLDGLASASLTLSASIGFSLKPPVPPVHLELDPPSMRLGPETIGLLASCSVGIHISICWVVSVSWDGSWTFQQSITTPELTVST